VPGRRPPPDRARRGRTRADRALAQPSERVRQVAREQLLEPFAKIGVHLGEQLQSGRGDEVQQ
jgi:hypothetical protein